MKLGTPTDGRRRNAWLLMAGIGTAAALTLAPVAVVQGGQAGASTVVTTTTTTVATNGTWSSPTNTVTTTNALAECPVTTNGGYTYATIAGATWIWANLGQAGCLSTKHGPGAVESSTVTLSTTFTISGTPQGATATLAADNGASVYVNTKPVETLPKTGNPTSNFKTVHAFTIAATVFVTGTNTITIVGHNGTPTSYNPAGVIAKFTVLWSATTANLCKKTGWRDWTTTPGPFSNQGDCVSYFVKNPNGNDPTIPNTANS